MQLLPYIAVIQIVFLYQNCSQLSYFFSWNKLFQRYVLRWKILKIFLCLSTTKLHILPAYENLLNLKVRASKFSDLVDIVLYTNHENFGTLREFLLFCDYGLRDIGSSIHFLL